MLRENTGTALLDSGDFYGRHWQKNKGKTLAQFRADPVSSVRFYLHEGTPQIDSGSISVFHWLVNRFTYEPYYDVLFRAFLRYSDRHGTCNDAEDWIEKNLIKYENVSCASTVNSYNHECWLSQTLQITEAVGTNVYAIQVHGGCDVRSGYTTPRIFSLVEGSAWDFNILQIGCRNGHRWDAGDHGVFAIDEDYEDLFTYEARPYPVGGKFEQNVLYIDNESGMGYCPVCHAQITGEST